MSTLYRKYRPQQWNDVYGQPHIRETLTNAIRGNLLGQAYLFTGPRGTGKTTVARLLAKSINCTDRKDGKEPCGLCPNCIAFEEDRSFDIIEIDGASNNGVENIRELRETVKLPPMLGAKKIYIVDEAHMLSGGAWNALLKTLEEPPAHVIFILATTELRKIPETILSRCQRFDFSKFPTSIIIEKLVDIAKKENVIVEQDALEMIALSAEGGMRDAESLLAQVISLEDKHITNKEAATILGITERGTVLEFVSALGKRDLDTAILVLEKLSQKGCDFRSFANALEHFLREIMFLRLGENARQKLSGTVSSDNRSALHDLASLFSFQDIARLLELIHHARKEIRFASIEQIPLEIATLSFIFPEDLNTSPHFESQSESQKPIPPSPKSPSLLNIQNDKIEITSPLTTEKPLTVSEKITPKKEFEEKNKKEDDEKLETQMIPLSLIREKWSPFLEEVKRKNASLTLSLLNSVPLKSENGVLTISVQYPFLKERLEKPENRLTVENALATILGIKVQLIVQIAPQELPKDDPLIKNALDILGGKIIEN